MGLPEKQEEKEKRRPEQYPDPAYTVFFNGVVSEISMRESGVYSCVLRPSLWKLSLVNNYRQFSQMTIKDVIEEIVKTNWGLSCDTQGLGTLATYRTQDWMQMGESDWDYVQSLLQKVGGYYYFIHDDVDHKVVFANNPDCGVSYVNMPPAGSTDTSNPLQIYYTFTSQETLSEDDYLKSFSYTQKLVSPGIRNILAEPQAAWEENSPSKLHVYSKHSDNDKVLNHYRIFQFGTTRDLTSSLDKEDAWALTSQGFRLTGESTSPKFMPGHVFEARQAKEKPDPDRKDVLLMRPELDKQRFVILSVEHKATVDGSYTNRFTAALATGDVKELSSADTHVGSMLGRVVSKTDQRAQYHNHWMLDKGTPNFDPEVKTFYSGDGTPYTAMGVYVDFLDLKVANGPVWVKLSETMTTVPEAGVTVMVDRSRDDTDVPQISYIYEQKGSKNIMPNGTREITNVGDDYSTNYGDNRSISYGNSSTPNLDAAISKIDGEYASGNFKSASYSIGGEYRYSASDNGKAGTLSKSYSEGNNYSESYANENISHSEVGISKGYSKIGSSDDEFHVGTSVKTSTTDASSESTAVGAHNSNSATGIVNSNSATGVAVSISATGVSTQNSAEGISNNNSATGISRVNAITGVHTENKTVGLSTSGSVTGGAISVSLAGAVNDNSVVGASVRQSAVGASMTMSGGGASADISSFGTSMQVSAVGGVVKSVTENGVQVDLQSGLAKAGISGFTANVISALELKL